MPLAHGAPVQPALDRPAERVRVADAVNLQSVAAAGSRLVAVGERGVVIISDDQGKTWQQVSTPVSVGLTAVRFADAKHGWITGHGGAILATSNGGTTWTRQLEGRKAAQLLLESARSGGKAEAVAGAERLVAEGPDKPFFDLWFFDPMHGIAVGAYGLAFETTDGGKTWTPITSRLPEGLDRHLYGIRARADEVLIAGESGTVLHSKDRGRTFQRLALPYEGSLFTAEIGASGELVVAGLRGNVWRSTDAGQNWAQVPTPAPVAFVASALDAKNRILLANQGGTVFRFEGSALVRLPVHARLLNGLLSLSDDQLLTVSPRGLMATKIETQK
jgi:photosystem II stability/assembly factor-like uncharacterized protein